MEKRERETRTIDRTVLEDCLCGCRYAVERIVIDARTERVIAGGGIYQGRVSRRTVYCQQCGDTIMETP